MLRKACLVGAFTVWSQSIAFKIEIAALVIAGATFLQRGYKPLLDVKLDQMESVTLFVNCLVLISGQGVFVTDYEQVSNDVARVLFAIVVIVCIIVICWVVVNVIRHQPDDDDDSDSMMTVMTATDMDVIDIE